MLFPGVMGQKEETEKDNLPWVPAVCQGLFGAL